MEIQSLSTGISSYRNPQSSTSSSQSTEVYAPSAAVSTKGTSGTASDSAPIQDVLELSAEASGLSAGTQQSAGASASGTVTAQTYSDETVLTSVDGDVAEISSAARQAAKSAVSGTTQSTGSTSTADLTQYSDAELKNMMDSGKISRAEYNAEMTERKEQSAGDERKQSTKGVASGSTQVSEDVKIAS
jgi:hypothetical protein